MNSNNQTAYDLAIFRNFMELLEKHIYGGSVSLLVIIWLGSESISKNQIIISLIIATLLSGTTIFFYRQYKKDAFHYSLKTWYRLIYFATFTWGLVLGLLSLNFTNSENIYKIALYFVSVSSMITVSAPALCYYPRVYQLFAITIAVCAIPLFFLSNHLEHYFIIFLIWGTFSATHYASTLSQQLHTMTRLRIEQEADNKNKQRIINIISHDLNQPLQALNYWIDSAKKETVSFDIAEKSISNIQQMINSILQITKFREEQTNPQKTNFSAKEICDILNSNLYKQAKSKNIALIFKPNNIVLNTNYNQLNQALLNLISNAIKFTDEGEVIISFNETHNSKYIEVFDTGKGISKNEQQLIFNDFYKTNNQQEGLGLGLAIVKDICHQNDWEIELSSETNKGSTFKITIPK